MPILEPFPLWTGAAPLSRGSRPEDTPTLTPYLPDTKDGSPRAAMVICPGGGYAGLAPHEGNDYALFLNMHNITCFVLKYRLGSNGYRHPAMLYDAARAVRTVRAQATKWNIYPNHIGLMGSSAGGHLASTLLTHFDGGKPDAADPIDKISSRPDLGVLCYAVISMEDNLTHKGSQQNLLGDNPSKELKDLLSNEKQVTHETPPCFVWHTGEDTVVQPENSMEFASALRRNKVPFDLHIYEQGGHGIGLMDKPPFAKVHPWGNDLVYWLRARGF